MPRLNKRGNREIGMRIKRLRVARGLTQKQLAEMIGIKYQQVQKYESGKNAPSTTRAGPLCEALGTTPDQLILGPDSNENNKSFLTLSSFALRTAAKLDTLTKDQRRAVTEFLSAFDTTEK